MAKRSFQLKLSKLKQRWLSGWKQSQKARALQRGLKVESLETRQLMAGDTYVALNNNDDTVGLFAEGEAANDLVAFAKALDASGTTMYGAIWCSSCNQQKALFEDGADFLPFVEVTNPDRTPNQIATDENITEYPTWVFPDGSRLTGVVSLATLSQRSGVAIPQSSTPSFKTIGNQTVLTGSPLHIPVDAYDPNGNPLTITVTSSNPAVISAEVLQGSRSLKMAIEGRGDMVFELFEQEAPLPTGRIIQLAQAGFYDNVGTNKITFHRVIDGFMIQGGDPTGTGTGGSTLGDFDDQYNVNLQHNRTGVLSYAKSSDDTNDAQFFIIDQAQRNLDFNHSVSGQLVEGDSVREGISITPVNASDKPLNEVVIKSATVFNDTENGLIRLKAVGQTGSATITVIVTDTEGNSATQQFSATIGQDTFNSAPFLNPLPASIRTTRNIPTSVQLSSTDVEGDAPFYDAAKIGSIDYTLSTNSTTGLVNITPPNNFIGSFDVMLGVRQSTAANTVDTFDTQKVTVNVAPPAPTSLDLLAVSDSGTSNSDNLTNAGSLSFSVAGTIDGATVELRLGTTLIGSATASGTTTTVTTNNIAALGSGTYSITATQTVNNLISDASPALQIIYDATQPEAIPSVLIPTQANVGTVINIDLSNPEEGAGLVYGLTDAPAGMTVNSTTGLLNWLPAANQIGTQTFSLTLTDPAGNTRVQNFTINVADTAMVRFRLAVVSDANSPLSSLQSGQTFKLQVFTEDVRSDASGVFSAYLDLLYDSNLIELVGTSPVSFQSPYTNTPSANTSQAGLINEMGAFANSLAPIGPDERLLAVISMRAKASGSALFRTDAADDSSNAVGVYGIDTPVDTNRITFESLSVPISLNFQLNNDTFIANEDSTNNTLQVLSNDTVQGSTVLTVQSIGPLSNGGTATISPDGKSIRYTPASNFNGNETFTYTARDQNGAQATASVTVQVAPINDPPVANPDAITVSTGTTNNVLNVLSNDTSGPDSNETLRVQSVGVPSQGSTASVGNGGQNILYTPKNGFLGTETITYVLSDGNGGTATGTVTVTVVPANPPPTAVGDTATVAEDSAAIEIDAIANDSSSDPDETISISAVGTPNKGGTASLTSNGKIRYQPAPNFNGTELVTYTLLDSRGGTAIGTVTATVTPVNDAPVANDDSLQVLTGTVARTVNVLANDTDIDGDTLTISQVTQPSTGKGTVAISADQKSLLYTPPSETFTGVVTFGYTATDATGATDTANVTLNVVNYTPRAIGGSLVIPSTSPNAPISLVAGFPINLKGVDQFGAQVTQSTQAGLNGQYAFNDLAPGSYEITKPALAFLADGPRKLNVESNLTDGDSTTQNITVGSTLRPENIDIRDFLGSARKRKLSVAVSAGAPQQWYHSQAGWNGISNLTVQLNSSGTILTIQGVNGSNQNVQTQLPLSDKRVETRANENGMLLLSVKADAAQLNFETVPTNGSGEGEPNPQPLNTSVNRTVESTAEGENSGEKSTLSSTLSAPANSGLGLASPNVTPNQALRSLLGRNRMVANNATPNADAVDLAMTQLAPALRLSGDLENSLTNEALDKEFGLAADQLLGN